MARSKGVVELQLANVEKVNKMLSEMKAKLTSITGKFSSLNDSLKQLNTSMRSLNRSLSKLVDGIKAVKTAGNDQLNDAKIQKLLSDISHNKAKINKLQAQADDGSNLASAKVANLQIAGRIALANGQSGQALKQVQLQLAQLRLQKAQANAAPKPVKNTPPFGLNSILYSAFTGSFSHMVSKVAVNMMFKVMKNMPVIFDKISAVLGGSLTAVSASILGAIAAIVGLTVAVGMATKAYLDSASRSRIIGQGAGVTKMADLLAGALGLDANKVATDVSNTGGGWDVFMDKLDYIRQIQDPYLRKTAAKTMGLEDYLGVGDLSADRFRNLQNPESAEASTRIETLLAEIWMSLRYDITSILQSLKTLLVPIVAVVSGILTFVTTMIANVQGVLDFFAKVLEWILAKLGLKELANAARDLKSAAKGLDKLAKEGIYGAQDGSSRFGRQAHRPDVADFNWQVSYGMGL